MTRLRKLMLDELERRTYSQATRRAYQVVSTVLCKRCSRLTSFLFRCHIRICRGPAERSPAPRRWRRVSGGAELGHGKFGRLIPAPGPASVPAIRFESD